MLGRRLMDLQLVWLRGWWGLRAYTSRIDMQDYWLAFDSSRNGVPTAIAGFQPTFASQIYIFWTCTKCKSVRLRGTASRHRKKSIGSKKWLPYASNSFFRVWVPDDIGAIWVCWKSKRNQEPTGSSSPSPVKSSFEIYGSMSNYQTHVGIRFSTNSWVPWHCGKWTDGASSLGVGHLVAATSAIGLYHWAGIMSIWNFKFCCW